MKARNVSVSATASTRGDPAAHGSRLDLSPPLLPIAVAPRAARRFVSTSKRPARIAAARRGLAGRCSAIPSAPRRNSEGEEAQRQLRSGSRSGSGKVQAGRVDLLG
ncbi:hypothetical protein BT93_E1389 [Corymbia citriodora subsp. variegata]|nr:hypothetical protein BT93_E1389 [Corymbia citriodora subsp. variegata]